MTDSWEPTVPCMHCGVPTRMLGTEQCECCWHERRSGRMDMLEMLLSEALRFVERAAKEAEAAHDTPGGVEYSSFSAWDRKRDYEHMASRIRKILRRQLHARQ